MTEIDKRLIEVLDRLATQLENNHQPKRLWTFAETAHKLGVGETKIKELRRAKKLKVVHVGGSARVPTESIEEYIESLKAESEAG